MNKEQISAQIAVRSRRSYQREMSIVQAERAIELLVEIIVECLERGERVTFSRLGIIESYPKQYRGKPYTGIRLKAAKPLRDRLNKKQDETT